MKYKDQTQAKNRYKKALLVTATALTLGIGPVSTFVGTPAVYAATSYVPEVSVGQDGGITVNSTSGGANAQSLASILGKNALNAAINSAFTLDDFQNLTKELVTASLSLIPYGGAFMGSMVSAVWPDAGPSQLEQFMNAVGPVIDEKISDKDLLDIKTDLKTLQAHLQQFQDFVNASSNQVPAGVQMAPGSPEETGRQLALQVQNDFDKLISRSSKSGYEETELPVYTLAAAAHLEFLQFIMINGERHPRLQMDSATVKDLYGKAMQNNITTYQDHINKTFKSGNQKLMNQMHNIGIDVYSEGDTVAQFIEKIKPRVANNPVVVNLYQEKFQKLFDAKENFTKTTVNNETFKKVYAFVTRPSDELVKSNVTMSYSNSSGMPTFVTIKAQNVRDKGFQVNTVSIYQNAKLITSAPGVELGVNLGSNNADITKPIKIVVTINGYDYTVYEGLATNIK